MTEPIVPGAHAGSPDRFGYSWERFSTPTPEQEEQFRRWTALIDPEIGWRGKRILDVGCGAGRNSFWALKYGAAGGLAIDVDERSLDAARNNLAGYPDMEVRFESIYELKERQAFDLAFSIGVIHHLEEPELAVRQMAAAVKPGGTVLIWVYGYENMEFYVHVLQPLRQLLFSRLPLAWVSALAHVPTALLWTGLRLLPRGWLGLEYLRLLRGFPYSHLHHIIFDQMLPRIAHYWKREEVLDLMARSGLREVRILHVNGMSWAAAGMPA